MQFNFKLCGWPKVIELNQKCYQQNLINECK